MALIILYFTPLRSVPINYDCVPGGLSIHKCITAAHLTVRDACLHRPAELRCQISLNYT